MPPCAAPVCDRVGYSLVRTAVRVRWPDSSAARMPAPPAPTMTTSYLWWVTMAVLSVPWQASVLADGQGGVRVDARVEGEDHQRAQDDDDQRREVEQRLEEEPGARLRGVVVDDRAQPVGAVQLGEPQHQEVPDLPERVGPLAGDEAEVDLVDAAA